jgi:hypothetical protein
MLDILTCNWPLLTLDTYRKGLKACCIERNYLWGFVCKLELVTPPLHDSCISLLGEALSQDL